MNLPDDAIMRAKESADPADAQASLREIDAKLTLLSDPVERAGLLLNKAVFLGTLGQYVDAQAQLELARCEAQGDEGVQLSFEYIYGALCHQQQQYQEAYDRMTAALRTYSSRLAENEQRFIYREIQQYRAFELVELFRFADAVPVLQEVLTFEMKPDDRSVAVAGLGICYSKLGRYENAIESLLQALEMGLTPDWAGQAHCQLGIAYFHLGRLQDAKKEFQICEERATTYAIPARTLYGWLCRVCKGLGQIAESKRYWDLARPC